jgi:hypothetical protein
MSAEHDRLARQDFLERFNKDGPFPPQLFDHIAVMNNFVKDINGPAKDLKRELNDFHRPHHPGAKAAWPHQQNCFRHRRSSPRPKVSAPTIQRIILPQKRPWNRNNL